MAKEGGSIVKNHELKAMNGIVRLLDDLDPKTRTRVFAWISEREKNRVEEVSAPSTSGTSGSSTAPAAGSK